MMRATMESPVGLLTLIVDQGRLTGVYFENHKYDPPAAPMGGGGDETLLAARKQLEAYFAGRRQRFDLPLGPRGTAFQTRVWKALLDIPFGQTITYGAIAAALGDSKAVRAVGGAVGRNPLSIIVPCHRVIGADGGLTGFGGGLERKRFLLALERGEGRLL